MSLQKTGTTGVYKREGVKDTAFYIRYRLNGKVKDEKVGTKKDGMNIVKAKKILMKRQMNIFDDVIIKTDISKFSLIQLGEQYFKKFDDLAEKEEHLEKEDKQHKDKEGIRKEKSLFKTFWEDWELSILPFHKLKQKHFVEYIQDVRKKTKIVNRDFEEYILPKYSSKYILNAITLIKSIISHTNCTHNPLFLTPRKNLKQEQDLKDLYKDLKKKIEPRNSFLEPEEIKLLLKTLKNNPKQQQGYLIALIISVTGMRPDSALNLKIKDLDFRNKLIKTYDFKRKMFYNCNLPNILKDEITDFIKDRNSNDYIFYSEFTQAQKKLPATPEYINKEINKLFNSKKYGNDKIVLYSLRHSFATNLVRGTKGPDGKYIIPPVSIFEVQKLLNHANVDTTIKHYLKFAPSFSADSIEALSKNFL